MKKPKPTHYLGWVRTQKCEYFAGWPTCMDGDLAREHEGDGTYDVNAVSCKRCLGIIGRAIEPLAMRTP